MARRTVLLVEDNEDLRHIFKSALSMDYTVIEAADGLEALRRIDAQTRDVIVLDLQLPFVSGFGILYDLQNQPHTRDLPVIIVTASSEPLTQLDVSCVLRKPVSAERLLKAVRECSSRPDLA